MMRANPHPRPSLANAARFDVSHDRGWRRERLRVSFRERGGGGRRKGARAMANRVELIIGPMFSGKSGELRRRCNRLASVGRTVLFCKPALDSSSTGIPARDFDTECTAVAVESMQELCDATLEAHDVIAIDEAQFVPAVAQWVRRMDSEYCSKIIIIAGLSGDSEQNQWGEISKLIPLADDVAFVTALCKLCTTPTVAPFTRCLSEKTSQVAIRGEQVEYIPVCRLHAKPSAAAAQTPA